jgi:UDP-2,4-diacetamido-2,4,6-trideoxy-beta-L-altropyranose hydrolase
VRARLLTGAKYVMLRREFRRFPSSKPPRAASGEVVKRVLITLGGSDESNVTGQVLESLRQCAGPDCAIDVLIGPGNPHQAALRKQCKNIRNRVTLHVSPPAERLPELMAESEMAISAAGSSVYEFGFLGVPLILIVTASNQRPTARNLAALDAATALDAEVPGWTDQLAVEIQAYLENLSLRAKRAEKSRSLIDGQGACRVAEEMRALA